MATIERRKAKCGYCNTVRDSDPATLPFFEYRGPWSDWEKENCKHCNLHLNFHDNKHTFEAGPAKYDDFYCGCRGWD